MLRTANALLTLTLAITLGLVAPTVAEAQPPVVVELFTSQGCSSCPPANANLITLSQRSDLLVLSFAVTYWDRLGWKDTFGKPEFTDRQAVYEPALAQFGPYTPQMVVNGRTTAVGIRLPEVEALIASATPLSGPSLALDAAKLSIGTGTAPSGGADIWRVTYDPRTRSVPVGRGENAGHTLAHTHVVHDLERLGSWTGKARTLCLAAAPQGLHTAILIQQPNGGPILAAITD
ncbi:MAG: DUF1223 domain-containing protein [Devosia sp.]